MPVDIYSYDSHDTLSLEELELYHLLMDYRATNGLPTIPLSGGLTATAGRHAIDTVENIWAAGLDLPDGANLHSWSDAPYFGDHRDPEVMWEAPQRLGTSYTGTGFEISAAGYRDIEGALGGWQGSPGHDAVIMNTGIWSDSDWTAIGVGVELRQDFDLRYQGNAYHVWFGTETDPGGAPLIEGGAEGDVMRGTDFGDHMAGVGGNDALQGEMGDDTLDGGDGADTLNGGDGEDVLTGGASDADLRDVIFAGAGNDSANGGAGNDSISGGNGHDTIEGGAGADTVIGNAGNDVLTGSAFSDLLFGNDGFDFVNGGFGSDRLNGGEGADRFFHAGVGGHGSDWIQGFSHDEGDTLIWGGGTATVAAFQVNTAATEGAGDASIDEVFVIYRPTGQILWALVDGADEASIGLQLGGQLFDMLA